jgi:hypothetical protein
VINAETEQRAVQVRPGYQHPTLGAIGGWEGVVLRSFSAGGAVYCDVELSAKTIAGLSASEKGRFYSSKIVFTRFRVAERDTQPLPTAGPIPRREIAMAETQHEWYNEVGAHEQDPTKFVADRVAGGHVDFGRRQAILSLVGVGVFTLFMIALTQRDCNNGNSGNGSWGRSGGFSS